MKPIKVFATAIGATCVAAPAHASETVTYSYDALGRLISSSTAGGPNNGIVTGASFDPAGNRTGYSVSGATAALDMPRQNPTRFARLEENRSPGGNARNVNRR